MVSMSERLTAMQSQLDFSASAGDTCFVMAGRRSEHKVYLPFCSETLQWKVHFSHAHGYAALVPDFFFPEEDFQPLAASPAGVQVARVLDTWDDAADRLQVLFAQLLDSYAAYQRSKIRALAAGNARIQFELDTLTSAEGIADTVQCMVLPGNSGRSQVVFAASLSDASLQPLQPFLSRCLGQNEELCNHQLTKLQQAVKLKVLYYEPDNHAPPVRTLLMPAELEALMGVPALPDWTPSSCLVEYMPQASAAVSKHAAVAGPAAVQRWALLQALETAFGWSIELDTAAARSGTFQLTYDALNFHVTATMSSAFPQEQPVLALQDPHGCVVTYRHREYGWSPRWDPQEMGKRIDVFIRQQISDKMRNGHDKRQPML